MSGVAFFWYALLFLSHRILKALPLPTCLRIEASNSLGFLFMNAPGLPGHIRFNYTWPLVSLRKEILYTGPILWAPGMNKRWPFAYMNVPRIQPPLRCFILI